MFMRRMVMIAGVTCVLMASTAWAEPAVTFPFEGVVQGDHVNLRSGPDTTWYPVAKVMNGTRVTVLGKEYGWYKIDPPAGSFSWVMKDCITSTDGSKGKVSVPRVAVRAGSLLDEERRTAIQVLLGQGAEVKILGQSGTWYKIEPPAGACVWVSAKLVTPVKAAEPAVEETKADAAAATTQPVAKSDPVKVADATPTTKPAVEEKTPVVELDSSKTVVAESEKLVAKKDSATTKPAGEEKVADGKAATTRPTLDSVTTVEKDKDGLAEVASLAGSKSEGTTKVTTTKTKVTRTVTVSAPSGPKVKVTINAGDGPKTYVGQMVPELTALEKEYAAERSKPLSVRQWDAIKAGYEAIAATTGEANELSAALAASRVKSIEFDEQNIARLNDLMNVQREQTKTTTEIETQMTRIQTAMVRTPSDIWKDEGVLMASTVFQGPHVPKRYRLFDPKGNRTVAYIEPAESSNVVMEEYLGKYVQVTGRVYHDAAMNINIIKATEFVIKPEPAESK